MSGCYFCVTASLQTRAVRKNYGHFMANSRKNVHMLFHSPKKKTVRCLCSCFCISSILIIYSLSVVEQFVIPFDRHHVLIKQLT